ncbi:MAG: hypothetical protein ACXWL5_01435 [Candidatus Chromulinivorax sp.]
MRKNFKILCTLLTFAATSQLKSEAELAISKNLFLHRAFSANTAREMYMQGPVMSTDFDGFFSFFSFTGAYQHSWQQNEDTGLGAFPFWSGTNTMTVGTNSNFSNLDAYQFGLGQVSQNGSITLNPIVYQGGADFMLYFGSSINDPGVFLKLKAPLGIIGINPELTEVPATLSTTATPSPYNYNAQYQPGALSVSTQPVNDPATTMTQAFAGNLANGQNKNGDFLPMQFGLIDGKQLSGTQFGDIEMALGYNFIANEDNLFGVAFRASAPSANKPTCQYLMEPIFGRGSSWTVGGYLVGKTKLWEDHANKSLTLNIMATILHWVKSSTIRSFDLSANGVGSKYLLVADYNNNAYQGVIQNLINLSTLSANSSISAEGDASIALSYLANSFEFDFGYNFWGRTAEILSISGDFPNNQYAVLGRQTVGEPGNPGVNANQACQPLATINLSAAPVSVPVDPNTQVTSQSSVVSALTPANRISGNSAFDLDGAAQNSSSTSKLFAKVSYSNLDSHFSPHIGLAGEFEISTNYNNALAQWSVALVGGMYF